MIWELCSLESQRGFQIFELSFGEYSVFSVLGMSSGRIYMRYNGIWRNICRSDLLVPTNFRRSNQVRRLDVWNLKMIRSPLNTFQAVHRPGFILIRQLFPDYRYQKNFSRVVHWFHAIQYIVFGIPLRICFLGEFLIAPTSFVLWVGSIRGICADQNQIQTRSLLRQDGVEREKSPW